MSNFSIYFLSNFYFSSQYSYFPYCNISPFVDSCLSLLWHWNQHLRLHIHYYKIIKKMSNFYEQTELQRMQFLVHISEANSFDIGKEMSTNVQEYMEKTKYGTFFWWHSWGDKSWKSSFLNCLNQLYKLLSRIDTVL